MSLPIGAHVILNSGGPVGLVVDFDDKGWVCVAYRYTSGVVEHWFLAECLTNVDARDDEKR